MFKKLLCATDGSKSSEKAVDFAIKFANQLDAEVVFITADTVTNDNISHTRFWDAEILEAVDEQTNKELHSAQVKAEKAGVKKFNCVSAHGTNLSSTIIDYAEENGFDHIITGSTGKAGISRALMGSVSSDIVSLAHCPVTIVR